MNHQIIQTSDAPEAIGPYSQAVVHNNMVYCSGQIALNPQTNTLVTGGVKEEAGQVMENLKAVLIKAGTHFGKVIKCSIFLADMDDFSAVNEVYGECFGENPPARETVAVKTLPKNVRVEISCIAYI